MRRVEWIDKKPLTSREVHLREKKRKNFFKLTFLGFLGFLFLSFFLSIALLWQQGILQEKYKEAVDYVLDLTGHLGLKINDISVEGRMETPREDILNALGVKRGMPIFAFDPMIAKKNLESLPWIAQASIERRLPDSIYINLNEKMPIALWQFQGKLSLIDNEGTTIPVANHQDYKNLPLIVGEDAPRFASSLFEILDSESHLKSLIHSAVIVSKRRWNIHLKNGMVVKLPEKNASAAWTQLSLLDKEHKLLERDISVIDFRLPDRLVIRMTSTTNNTQEKEKEIDSKEKKQRLST